MFVKPAEGLIVRVPQTGQIVPGDGIEVPDNNQYWQRRLRDGDVVLAVKRRPRKAIKPGAAEASPPATEETS